MSATSIILSVLCAIVCVIGEGGRTPPTKLYVDGRDREHGYTIIDEQIRYSGWRQVLRRRVSAPHLGDKHLDFDVIDQAKSCGAVVIFAWNSTSKTATIIREYMPGPHRVLSGLAAGIVEDDKHGIELDGRESLELIAARCELEEECHLAGGTWYRLTDEGVSISMDKYVVTEITPWLVIDPEHVLKPRPMDDEEDIVIISGVPTDDILKTIREGDMNIVGAFASLLALEKLRSLGEI
mmetsp:Transcript_22752/g.51565  ORF Transcript_22752/g.51565 Transcript_22752/m.51565 type:complete len:238 (-) Transcript_22752:125-838(-)